VDRRAFDGVGEIRHPRPSPLTLPLVDKAHHRDLALASDDEVRVAERLLGQARHVGPAHDHRDVALVKGVRDLEGARRSRGYRRYPDEVCRAKRLEIEGASSSAITEASQPRPRIIVARMRLPSLGSAKREKMWRFGEPGSTKTIRRMLPPLSERARRRGAATVAPPVGRRSVGHFAS